jgi:inner membrane protein
MNFRALGRLLTEPRHQSYVKIAILGLLVAASLLPLQSIRGLILERQETSIAAEEDIVGSWGGEQRIVGPVLVVPLTMGPTNRDVTSSDMDTGITYADDGGGSKIDRLFITPESLSIDVELRPQVRRRGIYETLLYTAEATISGAFAPPDLEALGIGDNGRWQWDEARIEVYVFDNRGIIDASNLDWNGVLLPFQAGKSENSELVASLPPLAFAQATRPLSFSFKLDLKGSRSFGFTPLGGKTAATIRSPWPHPSFYGGFPPIETSVTDDGFEARWELSRFERELKRAWLGNDDTIERIRLRTTIRGALVALIDPVDHYLKSERSVKYGILFVILVSSVLFVFEIVSGARVHPIQYGMVAAALCLFFLLLLSLSEAIGFDAGYLVAAGLTVALLSFYIAGVLRSRRRGAALAGLLAVVYGYMYLTLRSEDHALLLGSVLLFGVLAGAMIVTRRLDWYAVGARLPAVDGTGGGPSVPTNQDS